MILYGTGCRLSHSCRPNCFRTVRPDGTLLVRATQDIAAGDELTISYLRPEKMFSSAAERAQYLSEGYLFSCDCKGCTAELDDTRGAACEHCEAGVVVLPIRQVGPAVCSDCGREMDAEKVCHWWIPHRFTLLLRSQGDRLTRT